MSINTMYTSSAYKTIFAMYSTIFHMFLFLFLFYRCDITFND